ncbi:MAG: hypothetical protein KQA31_01920 [Candidatus Aenigmarchaeota archaeon]|nr:hypothetical protein [Candidatus Aenigmarchaeota archaeon]
MNIFSRPQKFDRDEIEDIVTAEKVFGDFGLYCRENDRFENNWGYILSKYLEVRDYNQMAKEMNKKPEKVQQLVARALYNLQIFAGRKHHIKRY